ncbi:MAG: hypothetical protein MUF73_08930 [Rhodobacteraceae bacterium]|jgi:hypothetical protein|nr:hypothetical protein [Paracoccaceae bacterium]
MTAANKILTVSYGTFSCTIEGFEDPLGTIKEVAGYFRDLAAQDRDFGTAPILPDADALRLIAEREVDHPVDVQVAAGAVHLGRRGDGAPAARARTSRPDAGSATILTPSDVIDPAPLSVAERLSRIRAVVARARTQPLWPDEDAVLADSPGTPAFAGDATPGLAAVGVNVDVTGGDAAGVDLVAVGLGDRAPDARPALADTPAAPEPPQDAEADVPVARVTATPAALGDDAAQDTDPAAQVDAPQTHEAVGDAGHAAATGAAGSAQPGEDATLGEMARWEAAAPAGPAYVSPELPVARIAVLESTDHAAAASTGRIEDLLSGRIDTTDLYDDADEDVTPAAAATGGDDPLLAAIRAVGAAMDEPDTGAADARADDRIVGTGGAADAMGDDWTDTSDDRALDWDDGAWTDVATAPAADGHPTTGHDTLHLGAHWRTDRDDQQDPSAASRIWHADAPDDDGADDDAADGADAALADLAGAGPADVDTAWVKADADVDHDAVALADHAPPAEDAARDTGDPAVDRLLAATNSQLDSTEVNRRRSAIAHLKAAVAAARADRMSDDRAIAAAPADTALHKFREDLARVVRPRRPVDQDQPRPTRRLPPLMLVSEQRIDVGATRTRNEDAVAGPVRPRRVLTRDGGEGDLGTPLAVAPGGFADFAVSMGARDLTDMIEAAAAYTAFVEGRPSFSRPQLMQMMRAGDGDDDPSFSREEQLRSFGLLLRQGRIQKLKRGQFTVAEDTRFRPTQHHAGE